MIKQTLTKTVVVKVNGSWKKLQKDAEVPTRYSSWKSISLLIDTILDQSVDDYAILHKPFIPVLMWHSRNCHQGDSDPHPDRLDFKSKPSNPTKCESKSVTRPPTAISSGAPSGSPPCPRQSGWWPSTVPAGHPPTSPPHRWHSLSTCPSTAETTLPSGTAGGRMPPLTP